MRIKILAVGENRVSYLVKGEDDFLHRLKHYCTIEMWSVKSEKIKMGRRREEIFKKEAERLFKQIPERSMVIILDRNGKEYSSEELAEKLSVWQNKGIRNLVIIIGGPLGLSCSIKKKADVVLSLSRLTFTHEMIRLILLEQIYRAFTILKGEKYHK
jgi:23S rRNA (pseudouridine1915-N3)-methyltransferase